MTTTTLDMRVTHARRRSGRLLGPLGGLGLVAGLIGLIASPAGEDTGETPAEVVAYAASHEGWTVAILLFALGSIALSAAFVAGIHERLRDVLTPTEGALVLVGGTVFALCFAMCWIVWGAPLADMPDDGVRALAQAEAYLGYDDIGWFLLAAAGGAYLNLNFHWKMLPLPKGLIVGHAGAAVVGFGLLLMATWSAVRP